MDPNRRPIDSITPTTPIDPRKIEPSTIDRTVEGPTVDRPTVAGPTIDVTPHVPPPTQGGSSGLGFMVGGLLIALLAVGYFALGMPGLQRNEARVPEPTSSTTLTAPAPTAEPAPTTITPSTPANPAQPRQ